MAFKVSISTVWREVTLILITAVNRRLKPNAKSMVARYLQRRTSSKPTVSQRAAFNEKAVDHRCGNARSTAHDAGPALTQRCLSILCYLGTASPPFTAWPESSQIYFSLETCIFYSRNNYTFLEGNILICWQLNLYTAL